MRRNRLIWLIVWIISLMVISFFGGPVSYGFFAVVTLIPLIAILYLLLVYILFHIYQKIDNTWIVANQTVPFYLTLVNDYYFVFSGIKIKFYSSFSQISGLDEDIEYELFPNTGITKETSLLCKYRGEYEVGIKNVIIQDFFRLFRISYHNREPLRVTVRPQLVHIDSIKSVDINASLREVETKASELDVLVRGYVPGDDIRQVHWGITAKSGELMIRKRIGEEQQGVGIIMSTHRFSKDQFSYLPVENKMLETALAVALYFIRKGIPVTHFQHTKELEMKNLVRLAQFDEYYNYISDVVFAEERTDDLLFLEAIQNQQLLDYKAIFIILHYLDQSAMQLLDVLSKNNVFTVVYIVNEHVDKELISHKLPGVDIVNILPEEDLMEVL